MTLKITKLRKSFNDLKVLKGIDLAVAPGEIVALVGSSGAGKSTLLRCINQIEEPTSGKVVLNEVDLLRSDAKAREMRNHIGMVFQQFNLFPHLTVLENIILSPMKVDKQPRELAVKNAKDILKKLGMLDKADVHPGSLSGGQQQRVAIARELAKNPDLMLFDEPTSALDPANVDGLVEIIKGLAGEGMMVVVVTHDIRFALDVASRVIFLSKGKIVADDTPANIVESDQPTVYNFFQSALN
jgi:ABC superfamily ATP binding cassette transporter, ABC protein